MEGLNHNPNDHQQTQSIVDPSTSTGSASQSATQSKGSSQDSTLEEALNSVLAPEDQLSTAAVADDHDHAPQTSKFVTHIDDLSTLDGVRSLDVKKVGRDLSFKDNLGSKGDLLNPRGGTNVVIGSGDSDIIRATGGGFNTITTGTGKDSIILGKETTNRIFDFDPANDRFVLAGINPKHILIAQGKNPGKGGLEQPLDSVNNALVLDKRTNHILAALPFVKASDLNESHFVRDTKEAEASLKELRAQGFFKNQKGDGKISGTQGHDRLVGGDGNDFLYVGDDGFSIGKATGGGGTEFPFPTDSPGTSELNLELKNGVLKATGSYTNFDGLPLFSQGETTLDPNAKILSGANPQALMDGFLKVPKDVEGNLISGTHLHLSPAGDNRGNFADATVIRYFENTPTDAKSGTITGEFKLSAEEQAALLAGNLYVNLHTNIDGDKDGRAGFATGENRINLNKDVIRFV
jgi:hypothetical protein